MQHVAVDGEHVELGQVVVAEAHQLLGHLQVAFLATVETTVLQCVAEHVEVERAAQVIEPVVLTFGVLGIELQELQVVVGAEEMDADGVDIDALEEHRQVVDRVHLLGAEADGCGAALQRIEGYGVGLLQVADADVLTHVPHVVVGVLATGVGHLAGVAVQILQTLQILGTIVGLHLEPLDGAPHQFFLIVGTFEVFVDDFFPFLGRDGGEF